jgi:hypothetical protein
MKNLMAGVKNNGPFIQGFAPDPAETVAQTINFDDNVTVPVPPGALMARYQVAAGKDVTAQLVYTDDEGAPATEICGWVAATDTIVFPPARTVTGIKFTNHATGSAVALCVRFA